MANGEAEKTLRRSFARAFAASSLICAHQTKPQATVGGIKQFLLLVLSCHMFSGLNKDALFSVVCTKNDRFSKKKTQH